MAISLVLLAITLSLRGLSDNYDVINQKSIFGRLNSHGLFPKTENWPVPNLGLI